MFFKINGKIIFVDENKKKIKLLLYNQTDIDHFNHILSIIKYKPHDNNIYSLKLTNKTKCIIDDFIKYDNLSDLLNLNVTISGYTKFYCFDLNKNNSDDLNYIKSDINQNNNIIKGQSFFINKIINYLDNN
jgi:hypothetical protein